MKIFLFLLISLMIISAVTAAPGLSIPKNWPKKKPLERYLDVLPKPLPKSQTGKHTGDDITVDSIKQKNHISDEFSITSLGKTESGQKASGGNNKLKDDSDSVVVSSSSHETSFKLSETNPVIKFKAVDKQEQEEHLADYFRNEYERLYALHTSNLPNKMSEKSPELKTKEASDNFGGSNNPGKSSNPSIQPKSAEKTGTSDENKLKRDNSHIDSDDASVSIKDIPLNKIIKTSPDSKTSQAPDDLGKSSNPGKSFREGDIDHSVSHLVIKPKAIERKEQEKHLGDYFRNEYERFLADYRSNLLNKMSKKSPEPPKAGEKAGASEENKLKRDHSHIDSDDASVSIKDIPLNKITKTSSDSKTKEASDNFGKFSNPEKSVNPSVQSRAGEKAGASDENSKLIKDDSHLNRPSSSSDKTSSKLSETSSDSKTKGASDNSGGSSNPEKSLNPFIKPGVGEKAGASDENNNFMRDNSHKDSDGKTSLLKDDSLHKTMETSPKQQESDDFADFGEFSHVKDSENPFMLNPDRKIEPSVINNKRKWHDSDTDSEDEFDGTIYITRSDKGMKNYLNSKTNQASDNFGESSDPKKSFRKGDMVDPISYNIRRPQTSEKVGTQNFINDSFKRALDLNLKRYPSNHPYKTSKTSSESKTKEASDDIGQSSKRKDNNSENDQLSSIHSPSSSGNTGAGAKADNPNENKKLEKDMDEEDMN